MFYRFWQLSTMDISRDGSSDKKLILNELSRCLKTVFIEASNSVKCSAHLSPNSPLILCVDRTLQHGLLNLLHGYWPLVRIYSHAETLQTIDNWVSSHGPQRNKGQTWLLATLAEGSFLSYLHCILGESRAIERLYAPHAILRDPSCVSQLSSLLTGLESINFSLEKCFEFNHESLLCPGLEESVKPILELPLNGTLGVPGPMTSSMTSSLASPGDSGFTQIDSETDTASFSEVVFETDCASVKEDIAVLPIDPCSEKTVGACSAMEPMTISDIANANAHFSPCGAQSPSLHGTVDWPPAIDSNEIVYKRPKTKIGKASSLKKRVSFHECTQGMPPNDVHVDNDTFSKDTSILSPSFRASASNLSRAVGDLSSFNCEQEGVEIAKDSSLLGNDGIEELAQTVNNTCEVEYSKHGVKFLSLVQSSQHTTENTLVAERGIPEGQEDPPHRCSMLTTVSSLTVISREKLQMSNHSSPATSCSSLRPQGSTPRRLQNSSYTLTGSSAPCSTNVFSQTPSKACLVNRFLRSITEKKISNQRSEAAIAALHKRKSSTKKLNLYINGVKPVDRLCQELLEELKTEVDGVISKSLHGLLHTNYLSVKISSSLKESLHCHLGLSGCNSVLKVLKIRNTAVDSKGIRTPLLAVITNNALYVVNHVLQMHSVTFHEELASILVGPNCQWISLISKKKALFQLNFLVSGGDIVSELITSIELALRRKGWMASQLPAVIHLLTEEFFAIPQWMPVLKGEKVCHCSAVHAIEEAPSLPSSSFVPDMKAYFMYMICGKSSTVLWKPGFFVLKAGILSVSSDEDMPPLHVINLQEVECRSISLKSRPHTIEAGFLHIAAPDDFVAHEWLVALQKASSEAHETSATEFQPNILSGSLLLTESRLMLISTLGIPNEDLDEAAKPLLTAFVSDVTSVEISDKESCWCVVEFSCREVHESGGDYVIFFSTFNEMLSFRDSLKKLSPISEQGSRSSLEKQTLQRRCKDIVAGLSYHWSFDVPEK